MNPPRPTPTRDSNPSDPISRAEHRRGKMEELSDLGMVMSREICHRWVDGPYHPEPRHDAGRSFALVSRAVRLTVVLEARFDEQILAYCNGATAAAKPWALDAPVASAGFGMSGSAAPRHTDANGARDRSGESSREYSEREADGLDEELEVSAGRECLIESEGGDERLDGDFDACVDVIRADLGLPLLYREGLRGGGEGAMDLPPVSEPHLSTPDFASLRLDPPQVGEGGAATSRGPPFVHLSHKEREGPARPLARGKVRGYTASG